MFHLLYFFFVVVVVVVVGASIDLEVLLVSFPIRLGLGFLGCFSCTRTLTILAILVLNCYIILLLEVVVIIHTIVFVFIVCLLAVFFPID